MRGAPGGIISLQGGGIIQESLGAIIPLQTGGFTGIGTIFSSQDGSRHPDLGRDRQEMPSQCAFDEAPHASQPHAAAQPKHQIPIESCPAHGGLVPRGLSDA
jgi:hypothetical protein